jgi:hypothetical protein
MSTHRFLASAVLIAAALFIPSPAAAKNVAVVIGVSSSAIPQVENHAAEVASALAVGGYEVHPLIDEDAVRGSIWTMLTKTLPSSLEAGDKVVIFISGGPVIGGDAEDSWFIPWGTELTGSGIEAGGIQISRLVTEMSAVFPTTVSCVVITDTTHSGEVADARLIGPDPSVWNDLGNVFALGPELPQLDLGWPGFGVALVAGLGGEADLDGDGSITLSEMERFMMTRAAVETNGAERIKTSGSLDPESVLLVLPPPATAAVPLEIPPSRSTEEKRPHRSLAAGFLAASVFSAAGSAVAYYAGKPLLEDPVAGDKKRYNTLRDLNLGFAIASGVTFTVGGTFLFVEF